MADLCIAAEQRVCRRYVDLLGRIGGLMRAVDSYRVAFPFHLQWCQRCPIEQARGRLPGGGGGQQLAGPGGLHQARGQINRIAHHGVRLAIGRTHQAAVDKAGGDADPRIHRQRQQLQRAADGPRRVVLVR